MKVLTLFLVLIPNIVNAFHLALTRKLPTTSLAVASDRTYPDSFGRAVECAETYGLCDVDELWKLSDGKF